MRQLFFLQAAIAVVAALFLGRDAWRRGRGGVARGGRARGSVRAALVAATLVSWVALSGVGTSRFLHEWDAFHYYVGSKYFAELGYERLYECVLAADLEAGGVAGIESSWIRDLRTNEIVPVGRLGSGRLDCAERFGEDRWRAFRQDVDWFRERFEPGRWLSLRTDHGFNAPPTWTLAGGLLTNLAPASGVQIGLLILLDPLLLLVAFLSIRRAFCGRTAAIALVFLGTGFTAGWDWTMGSILRYDWLAAVVVGTCMLRLGRSATGGALLAYAALVRLFPALMLVGVAAAIGLRMRDARSWRLGREARRLAAGAAITTLALLALPMLVYGVQVLPAFARNIRLHAATPLDNHVGLPALLAYDHAKREAVLRDPGRIDPYRPWREARIETAHARRPLRWLVSAAFLLLAGAALRGRPLWAAAAVGAGSVVVLVEVTCYYHAILLVLAFLDRERGWIGPGLLLLAGVSWVPLALGLPMDEIALWASVASLVLVLGATLSLARGPRGGETARIE